MCPEADVPPWFRLRELFYEKNNETLSRKKTGRPTWAASETREAVEVMLPALSDPAPSRACNGGFIRLDAEYLLRVRPRLGDAEGRVYEALVLCDGWERGSGSH